MISLKNHFLLDIFQFLAIGFNVTFMVFSTLSFNYEIISATLKITNASRTKHDQPFNTLMVFLPLITIATLCRISFAFVAVFFLKALSLVFFSNFVIWITFCLHKKCANSFKESLALAVMFFAPFQLGRERMPGTLFSRISCYNVTSFGYLTVLCLRPDPCWSEWISKLKYFILLLGALYGILTEVHIRCFARFYKSDEPSAGLVAPVVEQQSSVQGGHNHSPSTLLSMLHSAKTTDV